MKLPGKGMSWKEFLQALNREWNEDNMSSVAGSVTFSAVLALFPFLLCLVALGSLFVDPQKEAAIVDQLSRVAPAPVTHLIASRIRHLAAQPNGKLLGVGLIAALWAASGGVTTLMTALNTCYAVRESRPFWKTRGLALLMTMFAAVLSIVATAAAIALPPLATRFGGPLAAELIWLRLPAAALLIMFVWAVLYYALPDVEQRFRFITPGSVTGVLLWVVASWGFSEYVSHFAKYEATYGALAGVAILLLWMWISAQVFLVGAEINAIIEHKSPDGKRVGARRMSETGEDSAKSEKADAEKRPVVIVTSDRQEPRSPVRHRIRETAEALVILALFRSLFRRAKSS